MQTRRILAVAVVVVVIIVMALLIHGCQSSQTRDSLRNYNVSVSSLITRSYNTGQSLFRDLKATNSSGATKVTDEMNTLLAQANSELTDAENLSAPSQMSTAQRNLELALTMRRDGIERIAANIQEALNRNTAQDGVTQIALAGANFYGSDAVYMNYTVPEIARTLTGNGIAVGGTNGVTINNKQFLTDLGWLDPSTISVWVGAKVSSKQVNTDSPGTHGHKLNFTSVNGTELSSASTNTVSASTPPSFTLNFTNSGSNAELDVGCGISISGLDDNGSATVSRTTPGETTTCTVTLPSSPPAGTYQVTAKIDAVPGETNTANNQQTYSITFTG